MLTLLLAASLASDPVLVAKPDAFPTLVNPNCSHCVDEAKRRSGELRPDDPVLCWTRGYSDGGAIPIRFFLNPYRVISDSYGVFVYDPDAGYARGFAPSYNFVFHGWRNGVMVMKDKTDDTLYSCLTGEAFAGPRKGHRLTPVPTLVSTWGEVMARNPNAVAYQMFEKYKPVEVTRAVNADSVASRPAVVDSRLKAEEKVLGVRVGERAKAIRLKHLADSFGSNIFETKVGSENVYVYYSKKIATAYRSVAHQPRKYKGPNPDASGVSPADRGTPLPPETTFRDPVLVALDTDVRLGDGMVLYTKAESFESVWDISGTCRAGKWKDWKLEPADAVVCTWRAWSAEYPTTELHANPDPHPGDTSGANVNPPSGISQPPVDPVKQIAGTAEFLRLLPKPFATIKAVDPKAHTVTLLLDGETVPKVWPMEPDAEIKGGRVVGPIGAVQAEPKGLGVAATGPQQEREVRDHDCGRARASRRFTASNPSRPQISRRKKTGSVTSGRPTACPARRRSSTSSAAKWKSPSTTRPCAGAGI